MRVVRERLPVRLFGWCLADIACAVDGHSEATKDARAGEGGSQ